MSKIDEITRESWIISTFPEWGTWLNEDIENEEAVNFEEGNPEMDAKLFFTLASCNPEQHLGNMQRLSNLMMNEKVMEALLDAKTPEDLIEIQEKYMEE